MSSLNDMMEFSESSIQEILVDLLNGEKDLDLKTHIHKPKQLTSLVILSKYLKANKCKVSGKLLDDFIAKYIRYMVSYRRLSRTEVIKAISSLLDKEAIKMSFTEKITSNASSR